MKPVARRRLFIHNSSASEVWYKLPLEQTFCGKSGYWEKYFPDQIEDIDGNKRIGNLE
jgi:hypothetical protein